MAIVSLTTDFGIKDHYVAILKASILSRYQEVTFVDISHAVDSHDIVQGAFYLSNSYKHFPENAIHVAAVYNYYQSDFRLLVFKKEGQYFIGPDNGIFSLMFEDFTSTQVHEVNMQSLPPDQSLHQILAHVVACISHGLGLEEIGPAAENLKRKMGIQPVVTKNQIRATIIHIDHFENVVINLSQEQFEKVRQGREFEMYYKQHDPITMISKSYGSVDIGDVLCIFNSSGYLEISLNMGKASSMLGLHKNETVQINFL